MRKPSEMPGANSWKSLKENVQLFWELIPYIVTRRTNFIKFDEQIPYPFPLYLLFLCLFHWNVDVVVLIKKNDKKWYLVLLENNTVCDCDFFLNIIYFHPSLMLFQYFSYTFLYYEFQFLMLQSCQSGRLNWYFCLV